MDARADKPIRRILLSNDDGVDAIGLKILHDIATQFSDDVWVIAPSENRSGASRSITSVSYTHLTLPTTPYV